MRFVGIALDWTMAVEIASKAAHQSNVLRKVQIPSPRLVHNSKSRQRLREPLLAGFELLHGRFTLSRLYAAQGSRPRRKTARAFSPNQTRLLGKPVRPRAATCRSRAGGMPSALRGHAVMIRGVNAQSQNLSPIQYSRSCARLNLLVLPAAAVFECRSHAALACPRHYRFWQRGGGYDRNLTEPHTISAEIDYLHMNPARRGLCERAVDWHWSSAADYLAVRQGPLVLHPESLPRTPVG